MNNIINLINSGGIISYILIFMSVLSLSIIINRIFFYKTIERFSKESFLSKFVYFFEINDINGAYTYAEKSTKKNIFFCLIKVVLDLKEEKKEKIERVLNREIDNNIKKLEKYLIIIGTIANISVYFGLLGTIIGIIEAFSNISSQGLGGINVVIGGVSKALITTAFGLVVAIPAVTAYNYFLDKVENFTKDMESFSEELLSIIGK
jgi:biopolymer transport protein ExbB/TolQ